ncbi:MAG TPA: ABC transporter ATP-binding protein [Terriglobales bacterium]|nr:ABC transporter ATP-binding protein [Terriglobales bacterium]
MNSQFTLMGVRKYYGERLALDIDYLEISQRQLHIVTGANGSGKSTLLNVLAFLMRVEAGELQFDGKRVEWNGEGLQRLRMRVTLLHQSPYLFAGTVDYNLAYGLRLRGYDGHIIASRVSESLATVGLDGFGSRNVKHLSGGERRRVALARALALRPEVVLLDEPLANVDRATTRELERVIASLPDAGTTVVLSTHHVHQTEHLEGSIIALEEGRLDTANCRS